MAIGSKKGMDVVGISWKQMWVRFLTCAAESGAVGDLPWLLALLHNLNCCRECCLCWELCAAVEGIGIEEAAVMLLPWHRSKMLHLGLSKDRCFFSH